MANPPGTGPRGGWMQERCVRSGGDRVDLSGVLVVRLSDPGETVLLRVALHDIGVLGAREEGANGVLDVRVATPAGFSAQVLLVAVHADCSAGRHGDAVFDRGLEVDVDHNVPLRFDASG